MAKSIKLSNDTYWDSSSIVHNKELLSNMNLPKFRLIYENTDGGRDISLKEHGYGIYLLQLDSFKYGPSGLYVYRSETDHTQNIGFNYSHLEDSNTTTRVGSNDIFPFVVQAYRNDGTWPVFVRIIKLVDL